MATILEFKLPKQSRHQRIIKDSVITSTVNDVMLMIHHALHGTDESCRPKDQPLAAHLLDELANHITKCDEYEKVVLSHVVSSALMIRYPEMIAGHATIVR
ncbi:MAG: hypothetical protein L3J46_03010 [Kangiellaceae bacterium]|nr:hypothetical protein [Kangiellaceae bacterium]